MTLSQVGRLVRNYGLLILTLTIIGVALGVLYVRTTAPLYTAQSDVYLTTVGTEEAGELNASSIYAQSQARNFAAIAVRQMVLGRVIDNLDLPLTAADLARSVSATVPVNTSLISIQAQSTSPQQAAEVANATAAGLIAVVAELSPIRPGQPGITARTIQLAEIPHKPSSPNVAAFVSLGAGAGLVIGFGVALYVDSTRRRTSDSANPRDTGPTAIGQQEHPQLDTSATVDLTP